MADSEYNGSNHIKRHRRTAGRAWNRLNSRAGNKYGHGKHYEHVEVRMSREEFIDWATPQYEAWFKKHPNITPSLDRIEESGHYELGNLQLITISENSKSPVRNGTVVLLMAPHGVLDVRHIFQEGTLEFQPMMNMESVHIANHV